MGDSTDTGGDALTFTDPARGTYAKLVLRQEKLTGAILLGDNPSVGTVIQLFDRGGRLPVDPRALLLGRSTSADTSVESGHSEALIPDAAVICQCNSVTKGALVQCWGGGARDTAGLVAGTRATTGCGTCRDAVEGIAAWLHREGTA
jgi:assimilatory nitrate reductase electron transfer subunit